MLKRVASGREALCRDPRRRRESAASLTVLVVGGLLPPLLLGTPPALAGAKQPKIRPAVHARNLPARRSVDKRRLLARKNGVLDRVAYAVDGAESSYGTNPSMWRANPVAPQGPMQVSAAAASDVGGGNRFDPAENVILGRAYLAAMYHQFKSWPDAVAAYNWGPGNLNSWIDRGRPAAKLPPAVAAYRNRVLAAARLPVPPGGPWFGAGSLRYGARLRGRPSRAAIAAADRVVSLAALHSIYAEVMRSSFQ